MSGIASQKNSMMLPLISHCRVKLVYGCASQAICIPWRPGIQEGMNSIVIKHLLRCFSSMQLEFPATERVLSGDKGMETIRITHLHHLVR